MHGQVKSIRSPRSWSLGRKLSLTAWVYIVSISINVAVSSACLLLYFRPAFNQSNLVFEQQQRFEQARAAVRFERSVREEPEDTADSTSIPRPIGQSLSAILLELGEPSQAGTGEHLNLREIKAEIRMRAGNASLLSPTELAEVEALLTQAITLLARERDESLVRAGRAQEWVTGILVVNSVAGAGLCLAGLWFVRGWVVRPAAVLKSAASRIRDGDFRPQIVLPHDDEMGELGREMRDMASQIARLQAQLIDRERLIAAGGMIDCVEQHVREPLAVIGDLARDALARHQKNEQIADCQRRIDATVRHFQHWLAQLRAGLTASIDKSESADIQSVLEDVLAAVQPTLDRHHVDVVTQVDPGSRRVQLDVLAFEQALISLLTNAIQASSPGQTVRLIAAPCESSPGWIRIDVRDQGTGIRPDMLEKVFTPLFTTKPEGSGIGLGLARTIIQQHGGELSVQSAPGQGSCFTILLPVESCRTIAAPPLAGENSGQLATIGQPLPADASPQEPD